MKFGWIDFYSELATKLLAFKDDHKGLIEKIKEVYAKVNMDVPKLEKKMKLLTLIHSQFLVCLTKELKTPTE